MTLQEQKKIVEEGIAEILNKFEEATGLTVTGYATIREGVNATIVSLKLKAELK